MALKKDLPAERLKTGRKHCEHRLQAVGYAQSSGKTDRKLKCFQRGRAWTDVTTVVRFRRTTETGTLKQREDTAERALQ